MRTPLRQHRSCRDTGRVQLGIAWQVSAPSSRRAAGPSPPPEWEETNALRDGRRRARSPNKPPRRTRPRRRRPRAWPPPAGNVDGVTTVVFSGHMIDVPGRSTPRFPVEDVASVDAELRRAVADTSDPVAVAVSGAACGSDLLFCRAWLDTGRRLTVFLPRHTEAFLDESVRFAGPEWVERFFAVIGDPATTVVPPEPGMDELDAPHTPNNLRMLERARKSSPPIRGIFVWDGAGGDGPGGTGHMVSEVEASGGEVIIIRP